MILLYGDGCNVFWILEKINENECGKKIIKMIKHDLRDEIWMYDKKWEKDKCKLMMMSMLKKKL